MNTTATGIRVLVVDDEVDFQETVVKRLEKRGVFAVGVASGEAALAALAASAFDVVLLDIKMPGGMDGIDALREIKRLSPATEVILLTGHASIETSIEGMKLGAFDYLLKPIRFEEVLARIQAAGARSEGRIGTPAAHADAEDPGAGAEP